MRSVGPLWPTYNWSNLSLCASTPTRVACPRPALPPQADLRLLGPQHFSIPRRLPAIAVDAGRNSSPPACLPLAGEVNFYIAPLEAVAPAVHGRGPAASTPAGEVAEWLKATVC